jgi:hypothetical protein
VGDLDADRRVEQRAGEMVAGACAGRAELHLRLVRLGIGDERRQIVRRQILAHREHDCLPADQPDRHEVLERVVGRMFVERLAVREGPGRAGHQLIAVGRPLRHPGGADGAARAAHVLDDHLLAEYLRQSSGQHPRAAVGPAAGGERNDEGHRPGRPILRRGARGGQDAKRDADPDRIAQQRSPPHGSALVVMS